MPEDERGPGSGPASGSSGDGGPAGRGRGPEETWSWLGCLWIVVVPAVVLGAVVVTLNWLGC